MRNVLVSYAQNNSDWVICCLCIIWADICWRVSFLDAARCLTLDVFHVNVCLIIQRGHLECMRVCVSVVMFHYCVLIGSDASFANYISQAVCRDLVVRGNLICFSKHWLFKWVDSHISLCFFKLIHTFIWSISADLLKGQKASLIVIISAVLEQFAVELFLVVTEESDHLWLFTSDSMGMNLKTQKCWDVKFTDTWLMMSEQPFLITPDGLLNTVPKIFKCLASCSVGSQGERVLSCPPGNKALTKY